MPEDELPLKLPELDDFRPAEDGSSALARATEWIHTTCPKCGAPAEREIDTMPNWAGSSWYYIRYCDPHNDTAIADKAKARLLAARGLVQRRNGAYNAASAVLKILA